MERGSAWRRSRGEFAGLSVATPALLAAQHAERSCQDADKVARGPNPGGGRNEWLCEARAEGCGMADGSCDFQSSHCPRGSDDARDGRSCTPRLWPPATLSAFEIKAPLPTPAEGIETRWQILISEDATGARRVSLHAGERDDPNSAFSWRIIAQAVIGDAPQTPCLADSAGAERTSARLMHGSRRWALVSGRDSAFCPT